MTFNPVTDDISYFPPPVIPPANNEDSVFDVLEIAPGLAVKVRFINNNWHLIPTTAPVDVEGMVISRLVAKLRHPAEISYDEICCLINALANRRDSQINAWRNAQGLLGTDKPLPLTEISPLAMIEDDDQIINALPTAESSGNEIFDHIEYSYTCYQKGVWDLPVRFSVVGFGHGWDTFRIGDRIRLWLARQDTHEIVSPQFEITLEHRLYRGNMCWPEDQWMLWTKYGDPPESYRHLDRTDIGPVHPGGCGHLPSPWKNPTRPWEVPWPGDDSVALSIMVRYEYEPQRWGGPPNNLYYIHFEHVDKSKREYGIELTINYYNHEIGGNVTEIRRYSKYHRDESFMQYVRSEEIKVLDEMRVQGLINGPQWIKGKAILDGYVQAGVICPPLEFVPWIEPPPGPPWEPPPLPPGIEIPPYWPPELPPIPPIPEVPELPPGPPIIPPIFPKKICEKDILEGRWI